jgi:hypothetical protein
MDKLLEIGEIGLLRDIPAELTFMTNENYFLKKSNDKLKFEKTILICGVIFLIVAIVWIELEKNEEEPKSKSR